MAVSFYLRKTFEDRDPGIEFVNIHYTWTPLSQSPDWGSHRETRMMPRGGVMLRGSGGVTRDEHGEPGETIVERVELPDDGIRRKVLKLPNVLYIDGTVHEHYAFHHYFEIFQQGHQYHSGLYTEEIVSREIEYIDHVGNLGGMCVYWSIYDWDTPQYTPTDEHNFVAWYGEDSPFRSHRLYGSDDKDNFLRNKSAMVAALPMPRRFVAKVHGPRGSAIHQGWHTGSMWNENKDEEWEDYFGWYEHTL